MQIYKLHLYGSRIFIWSIFNESVFKTITWKDIRIMFGSKNFENKYEKKKIENEM